LPSNQYCKKHWFHSIRKSSNNYSVMKKNYLLIFVVALLFICNPALAQIENNNATNLIVNTLSGKVKGMQLNGVAVFKSIPYAAPPVGELRFAAPAPHAEWQGVRDASKPGPTAPFPRPVAGDIDDEPTIGNGWIK
jgi:para-nitrobenzyl esterase